MIFGINIKILIMVKLFTLKEKNNYIQEQDQSSSRFVGDNESLSNVIFLNMPYSNRLYNNHEPD